jgi:hypothetical protein
LEKRYALVAAGLGRAMLEHFFGELCDEDDLITMVKKYVASGQTYDGAMARAVRAVALRQVPVSEGSNTFYIHPASVAQLRRFLFGMRSATPQQAELAKGCLTHIDVLRDEHGIAENDARHPDVLSEVPWPLEAAQP